VVCFYGLLGFRSQLLSLSGFWVVCTVESVRESRGMIFAGRERQIVVHSRDQGVQLTPAISAEVTRCLVPSRILAICNSIVRVPARYLGNLEEPIDGKEDEAQVRAQRQQRRKE
jgi:hypothetical protein